MCSVSVLLTGINDSGKGFTTFTIPILILKLLPYLVTLKARSLITAECKQSRLRLSVNGEPTSNALQS